MRGRNAHKIRVVKKPQTMQRIADEARRRGLKIALVPTMGYFHEGHIALMRKARKIADVVVVSIFVNPIQFCPGEDFGAYPRDFARDRKLAEDVGVDIIFYPSEGDMYSQGFQTSIEVDKLSNHLCGLSRPGHFRGVTTVCAKLFNIIKPHCAVFGLKDYQQLLIVKRMVKDLNFDLKIIAYPTVRERDGLAMSSRNSYLSEDERRIASNIPRALELGQKFLKEGENRAEKIEKKVTEFLEKSGVKIDYVKVVDPRTLEDIDRVNKKALLALAVFIEKARLIDSKVIKI
jgi:pantoate--beta-alanine ligase